MGALTRHPDEVALVEASAAFLSERTRAPAIQDDATVVDATPGKALERRLNTEYQPGSPHYERLASLVRKGLADGWLANIEARLLIDGR